jgi:ankyrin repeat protein
MQEMKKREIVLGRNIHTSCLEVTEPEDDDGETALIHAARQGHFDTAEETLSRLLKSKVDADETDEVELQNAMANVVTYLVPFSATVSEYTNYSSSNNK